MHESGSGVVECTHNLPAIQFFIPMQRMRYITLIAAILLVSAPLAMPQQGPRDVVYLKNGSIIKGFVTEKHPRKTIKIETRDGSLLVFKMAEVEKIEKEEPASAPIAVQQRETTLMRTQPTSAEPEPNVRESPAIGQPGVAATPQWNGMTLGVNPAGVALGGLSWVALEIPLPTDNSIHLRADLLLVSYKDGTYHEDQTGYGLGASIRHYFSTPSALSGLFLGAGIESVYTEWSWHDYYTYYNAYGTSGSGDDFTVALSSQLGYAIALSNIRIEPSVAVAYFAVAAKSLSGGIAVAPSLQIGWHL